MNHLTQFYFKRTLVANKTPDVIHDTCTSLFKCRRYCECSKVQACGNPSLDQVSGCSRSLPPPLAADPPKSAVDYLPSSHLELRM